MKGEKKRIYLNFIHQFHGLNDANDLTFLHLISNLENKNKYYRGEKNHFVQKLLAKNNLYMMTKLRSTLILHINSYLVGLLTQDLTLINGGSPGAGLR